MEEGEDPTKAVNLQRFSVGQLTTEETGVKLNTISIYVEAFPFKDICYKCALQYAYTELKKELNRIK
jgi:hypothetical protein